MDPQTEFLERSLREVWAISSSNTFFFLRRHQMIAIRWYFLRG